MLESGDIIAKFTADYNVDTSKLLTYQFCFQEGNDDPAMFKTFRKLVKFGAESAGGFPELWAKLDDIQL
jgi:hypothetical protein